MYSLHCTLYTMKYLIYVICRQNYQKINKEDHQFLMLVLIFSFLKKTMLKLKNKMSELCMGMEWKCKSLI